MSSSTKENLLLLVLLLTLGYSCSTTEQDVATTAQKTRTGILSLDRTGTNTTHEIQVVQDRHPVSDLPSERAKSIVTTSSMWQPLETHEPLGTAAIRGTRIGLSENDEVGALRYELEPFRDGELVGTILDTCEFENALAALFGRHGTHADEDTVRHIEEMWSAAGCDGGIAHDLSSRYAYIGQDQTYYFATLERAQAYRDSVELESRSRHPTELPAGSTILGFLSINAPYGVEFLPADSSFDAVHILPTSLSRRGNVLRGLVRNWSQDKFAYGLTVEANGLNWSWPLSVQPGEVAPFELHGWNEALQIEEADFLVRAELSSDADLSRSFAIESTWQGEPLVRSRFGEMLPPAVIDQFPEGVSHVNWMSAVLKRPWSAQPTAAEGWRSVAEFEVRAFVAWILSDGSISHVMPIIPSLAYYFDENEQRLHDPFVVTHLPDPRVHNDFSLAYTPLFDQAHIVGQLLWIGGAHEPYGAGGN